MSSQKSLDLTFKRFDTTIPVPEYKTSGAAAFDLYARIEVSIQPGEVGYVPLNIAIELPKGYWALVAARSSLHKRGLSLANGIGVGDYDFRGPNDEYVAPLLNFSKEVVRVEKAERVAQMIILERPVVQLVEADDLAGTDRGGFGTTGRK